MKKIWIDITNTPHVNVLLPIIKELSKNNKLIITARDFSETLPLLKKNGITPIIIGKYKGKSRIFKIFGLFKRIYDLYFNVPSFDLSISLGGNYTSTISKLKNKKSIIFSDNDLSFKGFAYRFAGYFIFPTYFNDENIKLKYKLKEDRIFKFNGFKEDIYIADYKPDPSFLSNLPFEEFITIRPENLKASYVPKDSVTIIPDLFKALKNENILFLPRYPEEKKFATIYNNIFVPDKPLNGLDVCYYTKVMLTGAGTFAREAALMGTPAISFFPRKELLSVDRILVNQGLMIHTRDISTIVSYINNSKKRFVVNERSSKVKKEILDFIIQVLGD